MKVDKMTDHLHRLNGTGFYYRMATVLLFVTALSISGCTEKEQQRPQFKVPVKSAKTELKDVPMELKTVGTVEAYAVVNITSRVVGQVMRIHVEEGQEVGKGQLLFSIDDRPYQSALESARSNLARDRIRLEKARIDAVRYADLLRKDYVTKTQTEQAQTDAKALEAVIRGDEAELENAELNVSYCRITSPIDGRAGAILIHEGNLVRANDSNPLMVINQVRPIFVAFSVPEQHLQKIREELKSHDLKVLAAPPGNREQAREGRLTFVDNTISPDTASIDLKAVFSNEDNGFWPGQFVNVVLILGIMPQAVVAPSPAVQTGQQGTYVFVVGQDMTVLPREVTAGPQINGYTVIEKGLSAGEIVVTDGHLTLFPGAMVVLKGENTESGAAQP